MPWVENKTTIDDEDVLLFQDSSADLGSKTGFITIGKFKAELMPMALGTSYQKEDKPADAAEISSFFPSDAKILADLEGAMYFANTAPAAEAVISIQKNGVEFATMTIAIGSTSVATLSGTETSFIAGTDRISFVFPTPQDADWAGVSIMVKSVRI